VNVQYFTATTEKKGLEMQFVMSPPSKCDHRL